MDLEGGRVDNAVLKEYGETLVGGATGATSGSAYTVNIANGNMHHIVLVADCTFSFSNPTPSGTTTYFTLLLKQDGGARTATWPSTVRWAGGSAPTLSTDAGAYDLVSCLTTDGGATYIGFGGGTFSTLTPTGGYELYSWGLNTNGQLGQRDIVQRNMPEQVDTSSAWSGIGGGARFSTLVKSDGAAWMTGLNTNGQLGLGDVVHRSSPVQIGDNLAWSSTETAALWQHSLAIKRDGTLWAWGYNTQGQLGQGNVTHRSSPAQVGTLTTWATIAKGPRGNHSVVVKTDGTLWVWGIGTSGQLGIDSATSRSSPVQVGTLADWAAAGVGNAHTLAVKTDGTLWAWGGNTSGQLGQENTTNISSPVQIGTLTDWTKVAGGNIRSFAIKTDGTLWAWGDNGNDRALGLDLTSTTADRSSPVQIGTLTNWAEVSAASEHALARKTDGTGWGWGEGGDGQLGRGHTTSFSSPVQIGGGIGWSKLVAGNYHSLGLQDVSRFANSGYSVWGWGEGSSGQLGPDNLDRSSPVQLGTLAMWAGITGGTQHTLALGTDDTPWGLGEGGSGQLGLGTSSDTDALTRPPSLLYATKLAASISNSAAIGPGGMWTWGAGSGGGIGDGLAVSRSVPVQINSANSWVTIAGGVGASANFFAITSSGSAMVWGVNTDGMLGLGDTVDRSSAVVLGVSSVWASIEPGQRHTLGVRTNGTLWAWGNNIQGALGRGNVTYLSSPAQVGTLTDWQKIAAGSDFSTAIKTDGTLWSWGDGTSGQLGSGSQSHRSSPVQIGTLTTWSAVVSSRYTTVALKTDGTLWSWGDASIGTTGHSTETDISSPVQIGTLTTWKVIARATRGFLALRSDS